MKHISDEECMSNHFLLTTNYLSSACLDRYLLVLCPHVLRTYAKVAHIVMDPGFYTAPTTPVSIQSTAASTNVSLLSGTTAAVGDSDASFKCFESNPPTPVDNDNLDKTIGGETGVKDLGITAKLADLSLSRTERRFTSSQSPAMRRGSPIPKILRAVEGHGPALGPVTTTSTHKDESDPRMAVSPYIVAHDASKQRLFDKYAVPKSIQFELARGITDGYWTWGQITEALLRDLGRYERYFQKVQEIYKRLSPNSQEMKESQAQSNLSIL